MKNGFNTVDTFVFDGAPATPVAANLICKHSATADAGMALAGAGDKGVCGVTLEATNANGAAAVQLVGCAKITVGATTVNHGDYVMSDAAGKATSMTLSAAGAGTLKGCVGIAVNTATTGELVSVRLLPQNLFAA